ncbi:hypothetical protein ACQ1Z1_14235, partial [Enterococcus faecalis]|uniref:hypothetical protein n=1 Tax=Enterococcus faecalis TaxID=1351 RepID=UPI003D6BBCB8
SRAGYNIDRTSVDFPLPLTPVTAVSTPSGNLTSIFLRLFSRAPFIIIESRHLRLEAGTGMESRPVRNSAV